MLTTLLWVLAISLYVVVLASYIFFDFVPTFPAALGLATCIFIAIRKLFRLGRRY